MLWRMKLLNGINIECKVLLYKTKGQCLSNRVRYGGEIDLEQLMGVERGASVQRELIDRIGGRFEVKRFSARQEELIKKCFGNREAKD